jgi:hypothetical protein
MIDGFDVAEALLEGKELDQSEVEKLCLSGDNGDKLNALLYLIYHHKIEFKSALKEIEYLTKNQSTLGGWSHVAKYANHRSLRNLRLLINYCGGQDYISSSNAIRIATLVLSEAHSIIFYAMIFNLVKSNPSIKDDIYEEMLILRRTELANDIIESLFPP